MHPHPLHEHGCLDIHEKNDFPLVLESGRMPFCLCRMRLNFFGYGFRNGFCDPGPFFRIRFDIHFPADGSDPFPDIEQTKPFALCTFDDPCIKPPALVLLPAV